MALKTVALLHPGEMGAAIGACLGGRGLRVVWASARRSAATRSRASAAGMEDLGTLERALSVADIVLSVCPPHGALALASEVAGHGFGGVYIDANAISPATVRNIGRVVEAAEAPFGAAGIRGPPPVPGVSSRIYLSGGRARDIAAVFAGSNLEAIPLEGAAGAASALKACYAAWTKGATALRAAATSFPERSPQEQRESARRDCPGTLQIRHRRNQARRGEAASLAETQLGRKRIPDFQDIIDENSARGGRLQALAQGRQIPDGAHRLVSREPQGRAGQCASAGAQDPRNGRGGQRKPGQALF